MKKYEVLEHTADLKIRAFGKDLKELFCNIAEGMFHSISPKTIEPKPELEEKREKVSLTSTDREALLVDWLNELLYLYNVNRKIYIDFKISKLTDTELEAEVLGVTPKEEEVLIKAATYHGLKIEKKNSIWQVTVVFDI